MRACVNVCMRERVREREREREKERGTISDSSSSSSDMERCLENRDTLVHFCSLRFLDETYFQDRTRGTHHCLIHLHPDDTVEFNDH